LNSDAVLLNNAVKCFFDYWEEEKAKRPIGCLGGFLQNKDGHPIHSWAKYPTPKGVLKALLHMMFLPNVQFKQGTEAGRKPNRETVIDGYITGADLFLKNDEDARFDERYFMYSEEADLEYNHFYLQGKQCVLLSEPKIIHLEGGSDSTKQKEKYDFGRTSVMNLWLSEVIYLEKNHPKAKREIWVIKKILEFIWSRKKYRENAKKYLLKLTVIKE
jgi:hypothetical protein